MKNKIVISLLILMGIGAIFSACSPEEFELDELLPAQELDFSITQNAADPNMIILESLTPGLTPLWSHPLGRSTRVKDTVRLAFPGSYRFVYGAQSGGGFIQADTVILDVTTTNLSYVDDPLWNLLTGGVDQEKEWLLDLDADGTSKYFGGPLYFYGTDNGYLGDCFGDDCWNWNPDWAGNQWLMPAGDYGSMIFDLKGNANLNVNHNMLGRQETGTFFLDVDSKTLTSSDAFVLHDAGRDGQVINWGDLKVFSITENTLQLAALRDEALSGEGPTLLVYNFITKEYSDNWVPEDLPDPDPPIDLEGGTPADLISVTATKSWSLSPDSPFDWTDLDGNLLNGWQSVEDYPDWAGYTVADQAAVSSNQIIFSGDGTVKTVDNNGNELEGSYEVEAVTNIIQFTDITPLFNIGAWAQATTTSQNQWKIVKTALTGPIVTDIWFGKRDETGKDEYMVFHFVLGSSAVDPVELARLEMIAALTGPTGTRTFKVSDTWHVDWLNPDLSGGWTGPTTFADDFSSNSWVWTEAVKAGLQDPTLTFTADGSSMSVTKVQDGTTTTADVILDPENNTISIDMDLIAFTDAASWLPTYGSTWYICKSPLSAIETDGLWLGDLNDDQTEVTAIHYEIAE